MTRATGSPRSPIPMASSWRTPTTAPAGARKWSDQAGFTVNYAYNPLGLLSTLTDGTGATIIAYTYNNLGQLAREDKGNGTYTTFQYDADGNVLQLGELLAHRRGRQPLRLHLQRAGPANQHGHARRHVDLRLRRDRGIDQRGFRLHQSGHSEPEPGLHLRRQRQPHPDGHQRRHNQLHHEQPQRVHEHVGTAPLITYDADGNLDLCDQRLRTPPPTPTIRSTGWSA